jgi:hypothetical protein
MLVNEAGVHRWVELAQQLACRLRQRRSKLMLGNKE